MILVDSVLRDNHLIVECDDPVLVKSIAHIIGFQMTLTQSSAPAYGDLLIDVFDPATLNYTYHKDITPEDSQKAFDFFKNQGIPEIKEDANPIIMVTKAK